MAASGDIQKIGYGKYTTRSPDTPDTYGSSDSSSVSSVRGVSDDYPHQHMLEERQADFEAALTDDWRAHTLDCGCDNRVYGPAGEG